jgi:hypothetical protein
MNIYGEHAAAAYLSLTQHDSGSATRAVAQLSDSLCADCFLDWRKQGELSLARGNLETARREFERVLVYAWNVPTYVLSELYLGDVFDREGHTDLGRHAYADVRAAWLHADDSLRPFVSRAAAHAAR